MTKLSLRGAAASGAALLLLGGVAAAQGSNSCGSAQSIAGYGTWNVNTVGATTDGPSSCGNMANDVWFSWTATVSESVTANTCTSASFDTVLAARTSCGGGLISCNDDACGLSSSITFAATAGNVYLIQIGGFSGQTGTATLEIAAGSSSGGCTNPTVGPDVIVGDLTGISDYGSIGGVAAYSIGTTSCNIGDTPLLWQSSGLNHPVIGQNMFRLEDGRFEQIGQSWLKHGFAALAGNVCCTCSGPGGSQLDPGCSDPYGSGLNGSQGGLGPKFEVNPWTGAYAWPYTADNQTGNAIYKRIQVLNDDLDPNLHPGSTYYGEGQYVAADDAAAGNHFNNVGWRRMNVGSFSGGSWNVSFTGSTAREEPAIQAWQDVDPTVQLELASAVNDGIFIVGSNVYDNGNGTWDYEYAVYNQISERGARSFSVPILPGTNITNVGFHDVGYHSGEPFSGTDWTPVVSGSSVSWSTDTYAQDPNANAIRWGTLYNFRFTADAAPLAGQVELGLFKPGTGNSLAVDARVPDAGNGNAITVVCDPANNHTQGDYVKLNTSSLGAAGAGQSGLHLEATDGPLLEFGYFLVSNGANGSAAVSNGILCLDAPFGRYAPAAGAALNSAGQFDINGVYNSSIQLQQGWDVPDSLPSPPGPGVIQSGDTWYFQMWYRDGQRSNFSNAIQVVFP
jgi:hypothetical protein